MTVLGNTLSLVADVVARCRPLRFLFVGVLNTTFSYSLFALLVFIGLHIAAASLFAVLLGILFSFSTQGSIVFGNSFVAGVCEVRPGMAGHLCRLRWHGVRGAVFWIQCLLGWPGRGTRGGAPFVFCEWAIRFSAGADKEMTVVDYSFRDCGAPLCRKRRPRYYCDCAYGNRRYACAWAALYPSDPRYSDVYP